MGSYRDALATLSARHLAPRRWLPKIKAPKVLRYARMLAGHTPDRKRAALSMPPLLKTYLMMGGWVSDHAVLDFDLDTLHVFTGLEIRAIPEAAPAPCGWSRADLQAELCGATVTSQRKSLILTWKRVPAILPPHHIRGDSMSDKTLTRMDLSEAVFREVGLSRNESAQLVESVLQHMSDALVRGETVKISSFGTFSVREKASRMGRNPKTGEEVPISPRRVLSFRPSHLMKERVASGNA